MANDSQAHDENDTEPLLRAKFRNDSDHGTFKAPDTATSAGMSLHADTQGPIELTGWKLYLVFWSTWLSSFFAAIDTTMTSTMSATIATSFGSLALIGPLGSAYLIANAGIQPLSGKLTDIFGRRSGLMFASLAFITGNLLCGLATSRTMIIVGRAVAGIGGGGINSITTFVTTDVIPTRKRGFWQGIGMVLYGSGIGLGGVIGGGINESLGWRWAFLLLCPLSGMCAIAMYFAVPASLPHLQATGDESWVSRIRRIDFTGAVLLVAALTTLLVALDSESVRSSNGSGRPPASGTPRVVLATLLPLSVVLFLLFAYNESRTKHPIIALSLLSNRNVLCAYLAACCASVTLYTLMFHVPLFFQVRGATSGITGLLIVPEAAGIATGSMGSGLLMRLVGNYTYSKPVILTVFLAGAGGFFFSGWQTPVWAPEIYLFCNGLGFGGTITTVLIAMIAAIDHDMQAVATGALYAFRTIGASVGVSTSSALFRAVLESRGHGVDLGDGLDGMLEGGCRVATGIDAVTVCDVYAQALRAVFLMAFGFTIAALIFGLLIKNATLASSFDRRTDESRGEEES